MPEIGPMMRALELQRAIEDKVTEWRERSVRVAGRSVADSYQQPLNFKRHTNRRKNSAEINRIIAKYSKPKKRPVERYVPQTTPEIAPTRPARHKRTNLKLSKSEDNLLNVGVGSMEFHPDPTEIKPPPRRRYSLTKYNAKSYEDITVFVDIEHTRKSRNFEENSILNAKVVKPDLRPMLRSIGEDSDITVFKDSDLELRQKETFATSTPLSNRKTCPAGDSVSVSFEKCTNYNPNDLRKGSSEPDIIGADSGRASVTSTKTLDSKKRWSILKPRFQRGSLDCLLVWRRKKQRKEPKSR